MSPSNKTLGAGLLILAAVLWGGMFPAAKPILGEVDAYGMTFTRYGAAALVMGTLLALTEGRAAFATEGRHVRLALLGMAGFCGFSVLAFIGLRLSTAAHGAVMVALTPLLTALVHGVRTRSWPRATTLAAIALALFGVGLVVTGGHPATLLASRSALGDGLILIGALCWVMYTLGSHDFAHWSALRYTSVTVQFGFAGIVLVCLVAYQVGALHLPSSRELIHALPNLVYIAIGSSIVGVLAWNAGVRRLGVVNGALFFNLVPVSTFAVEAVGGRMPGAWELAGGACVIGALLINGLAARLPAPATPVDCASRA
ncbi:MAG: DMT family transporter [Rhodocyclaceae bacterium]